MNQINQRFGDEKHFNTEGGDAAGRDLDKSTSVNFYIGTGSSNTFSVQSIRELLQLLEQHGDTALIKRAYEASLPTDSSVFPPSEVTSYDDMVAQIQTSRQLQPFLKKLANDVDTPVAIRQKIEGLESTLQVPHNLSNSGAATFVGRGQSLSDLHEQLQKSERVAISALTGMGGIGKTELALQYAWQGQESKSFLGGICWLNVAEGSPETDILSFAKNHLHLPLPEEGILADRVNYCWQNWIEGEVLLIFDDVRDYQQIKDCLPPKVEKRFKVLITTRCEYLSAAVQTFHVEVLKENFSLELLRSYVQDGRIDAQIEHSKELCRDLGYLPLGLELVARLLKRRDWTISKIREKLAENGLKDKSLDKNPKFDAEMTAGRGVKAAFDLSWQELDDEPKAQNLALHLCLFALSPISKSLILDLLSDEDEDNVEEYLSDSLVHLNLVKYLGGEFYEIHPLIRLYLEEKLEEYNLQDAIKSTYCEVLTSRAMKISRALTPQVISTLDDLIPHVKEVIKKHFNYIPEPLLDKPIKGISSYYVCQGSYPEAIKYCEEYIEAAVAKFGADDIHLMILFNDLGLLYKDIDEYEKAGSALEKALSIAIECLGEDHHEVVTILNNLGDFYRQTDQHEKAEQIFTDLLPKLGLKFDADVDNIYISALSVCVPNNLGLVYSEIGKYDEAEHWFKVAIGKFSGSDQQNIYLAQAFNNLAGLYFKTGRLEEAESYYQRALDVNQKKLDPKHLNYILNLSGLANLYLQQERYEESEEKFVELFQLQLELDYLEPHALSALKYMASQYTDKGIYHKTESMYLRIIELQKKFNLVRSTGYCDSLNSLAGTYTFLEKISQSIELSREALATNQSLGSQGYSITAAHSYHNLGVAFWKQGLFDKAEEHSRLALNAYQEALDSDKKTSDLVFLSMIYNNLGLTLDDLGACTMTERKSKKQKQASNEL